MEFVSEDLYKRYVAVEGLTYEEGYLLPVNGNINNCNTPVWNIKIHIEF